MIKGGKLLSSEETRQLSAANSANRDKQIQAIVTELRAKAKRQARRTSGLRGRR